MSLKSITPLHACLSLAGIALWLAWMDVLTSWMTKMPVYAYLFTLALVALILAAYLLQLPTPPKTPEPPPLTARQIYLLHCRPHSVDLAAAVANGMIPKTDLKDGQWYLGSCRNSDHARWVANLDAFEYQRTKFNQQYVDHVPHPEDDIGFDVFVPVAMIGAPNDI